MTDDAHGLGVVGDGRGSSFARRRADRRAAANGHAVESRRQLRRLSLREPQRRGARAQSRAQLRLLDGLAARHRRGREPRARPHRDRQGARAPARRRARASSRRRSGCRRRRARSCRWCSAAPSARWRASAALRRRGLPRRGDPAADRAARHVAAARDVLRGAHAPSKSRRSRPPCGRCSPHDDASSSRRRAPDIGKTFVTLRLDRRARGRGPPRAGTEAGGLGFRRRAARRQRHGAAAARAGARRRPPRTSTP